MPIAAPGKDIRPATYDENAIKKKKKKKKLILERNDTRKTKKTKKKEEGPKLRTELSETEKD